MKWLLAVIVIVALAIIGVTYFTTVNKAEKSPSKTPQVLMAAPDSSDSGSVIQDTTMTPIPDSVAETLAPKPVSQ